MMQKSTTTKLHLLILIIYGLLIYSFLTLRFVGNWNEGDTANHTRVIYESDKANSVIDADRTYDNGAAFAAVSIFIVKVCGISVQTYLYHFAPYLALIVPLSAFLFYRTIFKGNGYIALISIALLLLQPDFLWVTWRGSHEKITWTLTCLMLFLLMKSYESAQTKNYQKYVALFYVIAFSFVTVNYLFASSFILMLVLSFVGGRIVLFLFHKTEATTDFDPHKSLTRLIYIATSTTLALYIFVFAIYPPIQRSIRSFGTVFDRLFAIFLGVEFAQTPYDYVVVSWLGTKTYLLLTAFTWLLLLVAAIKWIIDAVMYIRTKEITRQSFSYFILWLMFPAFSIQFLITFIMDLSGQLGGNFQIRLFPPIMLTAVPLAATAIRRVFALGQRKNRVLVYGISAAMVVFFSFASLLKSINEPSLNNNWIFTTTAERTSLLWSYNHVPETASSTTIWIGFNERLSTGLIATYPGASNLPFTIVRSEIPDEEDLFVFSELEKARFIQRGLSIPDFEAKNLIYDNGAVQVYRRVPQTPYQH